MNEHHSGGETFATYLAKYYVGRKGFNLGTVPEAQALCEACDIVLTLADGMTLQVVCIVDREAHPQKTFAMSRDALDGIGRQCLKYSGTVHGETMPVTFQVIEVGAGPASEEDRQRLGALQRKSLASKVILKSWILDTTAGTAWTNATIGGFFFERRFMEGLLRMPRVADADLRQPELATEGFPLLTVVLLIALAAVFVCELAFGVGPWSGLLTPNIQTLVALGGLNKTLVLESGEWHRIFSSAVLHADPVHLALNGFCLYLAGSALENLIGRRWFFALFVIGAASGSLLSLTLNPPSVVSVGASGAIMGLLAATFVCSFRYPSGPSRTQIQMATLQVLLPSLLPLAVSRTGQHIDFAGHLGGAVSGILVGLAMLKTWRFDSPRPAFLPLATALCALGALAFALSLLPVARGYHTYALDAFLIPNDQIPASETELKAKAANLIARYPRDPRARLYQASALIDRNDLPGAERELRAGLAEQEILSTKFKPELEAQMRVTLALVLSDRRQRPEAKVIAKPVCGTAAASLAPMRDLLRKQQLCE
jgi:rhomboid protease GluP